MRVAEYLFSRLRQLGIDSIHGVPGDYNLDLLDYVETAGLRWVSNANELNAAYAADGYARIKGISAVITTFGVGELSTVDAIAGAYTERAPVVHIVGIPARASQDARLSIHHTFNDGEYKRFAAVQSHVTVFQTRLWDLRTIAEQIDESLRQCVLQSRPVYIEIPVDLVAAEVSEGSLASPITTPAAESKPEYNALLAEILHKMHHAAHPYIFVDGEVRPMDVIDEIQSIVESTKWPTFSSPFGKGLLDETVSNFHGIYRGSYDVPEARSFIERADPVLCFGPHFSSSNTYGYSSIPRTAITIAISDTTVTLAGRAVRDIPAKYIISQLALKVQSAAFNTYNNYPKLPRDYKCSFADVLLEAKISHDKIWRLFANLIRPGDIILGETGTAGYGVRRMPLPQHTRLFTPVTWLSIGYMLPAAQGAALAQQELLKASKYHNIASAKTVLFIGDGSFQMTVQELGTIIRLDLDMIVILINNDGYTIERCIHGRNQGYNDISAWRYLKAPGFFGAKKSTYVSSASTYGQLQRILEDKDFINGKGLRMIEIIMEREDAPRGPLLNYLQNQIAKERPN